MFPPEAFLFQASLAITGFERYARVGCSRFSWLGILLRRFLLAVETLFVNL